MSVAEPFGDLAAERAAREAEGARIAAFAPSGCTEEAQRLSGAVPSLIVRPPGGGTGAVAALVHGGGWVYGSPRQDVGLARRIAVGTGRAVASIGYRRAPEDAFPAAHDDVENALVGLGSVGDLVGISAGANLALGATLRLRDRGGPMPSRLVLFYGVFDITLSGWSHRALDGDPTSLTAAKMRAFVDAYLPDHRDDSAARNLDADLTGLPPIHLICGDRDLLLSDTLALHARATDAGVPVSLEIAPGLDHGFAKRWHDDPRIDAILDRALPPSGKDTT
jgi:acetyl esterase